MLKVQNTTEAIVTLAHTLASVRERGYVYACSWCDSTFATAATYTYAEAASGLRGFIEHTAYDHAGRAEILRYLPERFAVVLN